MAETFGAVASAIGVLGVAAQCADGIRKLREFQKDVKSAKDDVGHMANELELLTLTIASIETQVKGSSRIATSVNAAEALRFCQRSIQETAKILQDIGSEIDKRKTGSIRAAWKKKSLEAYMTRIERAKSSLTMAYSIFTAELQKQDFLAVDARLLQQQGFVSISFEQRHAATDMRVDQLQELVGRGFDQLQNAIVATSLVNASQKQAESNQTQSVSMYGGAANDGKSTGSTYSSTQPQPNHKRKQKSVQVARFRFRLPYWFLKWCLDVEIYRSSRSWTLNLSPRRVVSTECELFQRFHPSGHPPSVRDVERMIIEGRASLHDVDMYDRNILHYVFRYTGRELNHSELQVLDWAIDHGVEVTAADDWGRTPLSMMFCSHHNEDGEVLAAIARRAIENCDQDPDVSLNQFRHAMCNDFVSTPSHHQFSIFQNHLIWEEVSLADRLDMLVTGFAYLESAETLDLWIGRDNWKRIWSECSPRQCRKLLNSLSDRLGSLCSHGFDYFDDSWDDIFSHLLQHLSNNEWGELPRRSIPYFAMLKGFLERFVYFHLVTLTSISEISEACQLAIKTFATYFAIHDMDLAALGRYEQLAVTNDRTSRLDTWGWEIWDRVNEKTWEVNIRIISMQYGARPEDWTIEVSNPVADAVAEVFGEFWGTVEKAVVTDAEAEVFRSVQDTVEQTTRRMPGMWDADEDGEEEDEEEEQGFCLPIISPEQLLQLEYIMRQEEKQERRVRYDESRLEGRNWDIETDSDEDLDE